MIVDSGSIYSTNYCTDFTGEQCVQWTSVQSLSKEDVKEIGSSVLFNAGIMIVVIYVIYGILKFLLSRIFK